MSTERLLRALIDVCGPYYVRAAGPADTVAGHPARFVVAPATTSAVAGTLRLAAEHDLAVVTRGAGSKLDWGAPPAGVDVLLDTRRLAGIWHHRPAEFTAEVGTGTPVQAVQAALALRGQRLALDPASPGATIGGVLAVNESGPLRHRFGTPHQQVREYALVGPDGAAGPAPGGADPLAGSATATLGGVSRGAPPPGVLVSAEVVVQPRPAARRWVTRGVQSPLQVHNFVAATLDADVSPDAIEVDLPVPGAAGPRPGLVAALLEGDPADVVKRSERLAGAIGVEASVTGRAPIWWGRYPFDRDDVALRLTVAAADLHSVVYALRDAARGAVPVRGSAGVGTVHAVLPGSMPPERVEQILETVRSVLLGRGGRCVVVSAPPPISARIDLAGRDDLF